MLRLDKGLVLVRRRVVLAGNPLRTDGGGYGHRYLTLGQKHASSEPDFLLQLISNDKKAGQDVVCIFWAGSR